MSYDLCIIGSGPGGYVAAIRAGQLGMKTALIEKYDSLGGTCLNVGCIPSKALLDSTHHYHEAKEKFETHGIEIDSMKVNMPQMIKRKREVIEQTVGGIEYLMKKNKIDVLHGIGSFKDANTIVITKDDGSTEEISSKKVIIATGSKPIVPKAFNYDKNRVITSTEALNIEDVPEKMVVIGAGVIGLELGSVFARLGTQVDVVEYQKDIIATMDKDCSKELKRSLKKLGMKFHLGHQVTEVNGTENSVSVSVQKRDAEDTLTLEADYCLVAIGRYAYTEGLGLENVDIKTDDRGRIETNEHLETNVPGIYAIGDVVKGAMLAHKAEEEGVFVVEQINGEKPHINYNLIPGVVYTWPEVSSVGVTEQQAKEQKLEYKIGKFPFKALGRARASMDLDGMVKIIADKNTDEILGAHIVGARAADLIMELASLMEFRATAEDLSRICHPHPTFSEAVKEAALAATANRALHV